MRARKAKLNAGPDPIDLEVGKRVMIMRKQRRLSQSALAQHLGVSFQQVQKYERGANRISASTLVRIAERLQTDVASLVGERGQIALEGDGLAVMSTPGAVALLNAYAALPTDALRASVLRLASQITAR